MSDNRITNLAPCIKENSEVSIWMPFYFGDFLRKTMHLSTLEQGAYLLLIAHYWTTSKPIPDNDARMRRITKMTEAEWKLSKSTLLEFFRLDNGLWIHDDIEAEIDNALAKREKRSLRGTSGANAKWNLDQANKATRSERLSKAREISTHTTSEWAALLKRCGDKCIRCGAVGKKIVKDHILPIYLGGSDGIENLQPLCARCNLSKGPESTDYRPIDWEECLPERLQNVCKTSAKRLTPADEGEGEGSYREVSKLVSKEEAHGTGRNGSAYNFPLDDDGSTDPSWDIDTGEVYS